MKVITWTPFRDMDDAFGRLLPARLGRWPRLTSDAESSSSFEWIIDHRMIRISGERNDKRETMGEQFHRIESFQGLFARSFSLPENVQQDAIRAEAADGVLTVHLPKQENEHSKSIEVKVQ